MSKTAKLFFIQKLFTYIIRFMSLCRS